MSFIKNLIADKTAGAASSDQYFEDEIDADEAADLPPTSTGETGAKNTPEVEAAKMDELFESGNVANPNNDFPRDPVPVGQETTPDVFELKNPIVGPEKAIEAPAADEDDQRTSFFETPSAAEATPHKQILRQSDPRSDAPADALSPPFPGAATTGRRRAGRVKTRLLGFDRASQSPTDLFNPEATIETVRQTRYPVGWIVIIDGPGRGESFTLQTGMSQIGRGEDQAIQLDFGDASISRNNHAAIVYDVENHIFLLGHGGKANVVRLNDKPLLSTENMKNADQIRIGETTLQLVVLCDEVFNWEDDSTKGADDVAIA